MTIDYKTMNIIMFPSLAVVPKVASRVPDSKFKDDYLHPGNLTYQIWKGNRELFKRSFWVSILVFRGVYIQKLLHVFPGAPFWEHGRTSSSLLKHHQIFETLSLDKRSTCHGGDRVGKSTHSSSLGVANLLTKARHLRCNLQSSQRWAAASWWSWCHVGKVLWKSKSWKILKSFVNGKGYIYFGYKIWETPEKVAIVCDNNEESDGIRVPCILECRVLYEHVLHLTTARLHDSNMFCCSVPDSCFFFPKSCERQNLPPQGGAKFKTLGEVMNLFEEREFHAMSFNDNLGVPPTH